jgi:outer membrane murein-binding lipoprotein Lpp
MKIVFPAVLAASLLVGCAAAHPLSITLYNPETKVSQTCAARSSIKTDVEVLSQVVEACARQLEAHGFVRVDASGLPEP